LEAAEEKAEQIQLLFDAFPALVFEASTRDVAIKTAIVFEKQTSQDKTDAPGLADRLKALHIDLTQDELIELLKDWRSPVLAIYSMLQVSMDHTELVNTVKPIVHQWIFTPGFCTSIASLLAQHSDFRSMAYDAIMESRLDTSKLGINWSAFRSAIGQTRWPENYPHVTSFNYDAYEVDPSGGFSVWQAGRRGKISANGEAFVTLSATALPGYATDARAG
jgi:hypothetical protein